MRSGNVVSVCLMSLFSVCVVGTPKVSAALEINLDFTIPTDGYVGGISLSPDESRLYAAFWEDSPSSRVQEYSLPDGQLLQTIAYGSYHTHGDVVVSADGNRIFTTNYYKNSVSQIELDNGNARTDLSTVDSWPANIDITPDRSKVLASVGMDGGSSDMNNDSIAIYDITNDNFSLLALVELNDEPQYRKIGFSSDSQFAFVVTRARKSDYARLYEISLDGTCEVTRSMEFEGITLLRGIAIDDGTAYVSSPSATTLWAVDLATWSVGSEMDLLDNPSELMMHPDGEHLFALFSDSQSVAAIDLASEQIVGRYDGLQLGVSDIEFSNDGSTMYVSHRTAGGDVFVFDVVPEPSTLVGLVSMGIMGLLIGLWRRFRKS